MGLRAGRPVQRFPRLFLRRLARHGPALLLAGTLLAPTPGHAGGLTNTETYISMQFNFNNPGARALSMGGAFIGLADDATAAVANPSGLVILQRPEVSAELKFSRYVNTVAGYRNTVDEANLNIFHSRDFDDAVFTPSFFSAVYPTQDFVFGAFLREPVNFESDFRTEGAFLSSVPPGQFPRIFPVKSYFRWTALSGGVAVAANLAKAHPLVPNLGASVEVSQAWIKSRLDRFAAVNFSPPNYAEENVVVRHRVDDSDVGFGFNVGALWRWRDLTAGLVYRRGAEYTVRETQSAGPAGPLFGLTGSRDFDVSFKIPDVYGAGVAYRFFDRLTLALDVVHIKYSQIVENVQVVSDVTGMIRGQDYRIDDGTEIHIGAEYFFFIREMPVAVRAGMYTDPDHRPRYVGQDVYSKVLVPGGKDRIHGTAGFGFVPVRGFQIDFGVNIADGMQEAVFSTVYRF